MKVLISMFNNESLLSSSVQNHLSRQSRQSEWTLNQRSDNVRVMKAAAQGYVKVSKWKGIRNGKLLTRVAMSKLGLMKMELSHS
jgi:hypothetical protein